jgi:hypothetical protein
MHQSVRTSSTKTGSGGGGPGAMADTGGLVDILETLLGAGVNLRTAGGRDLDEGGPFVFSVHHAEGDDEPDHQAAALLREHGYDAGVFKARECVVSDEPGSLLRCIRKAQEESPIYEIFVGTPDEEGHIAVQIVTKADLKRETAS